MAFASDRVRLMQLAAARRVAGMRAHLGALGDFVGHKGEVGRANEWILREAMAPYLPAFFSMATGFVHCHNRVTTQQDVLIYTADSPPLFRLGDAVVVDYFRSAVAAIEVKTTYTRDALRAVCATKGLSSDNFGVGLFAFNGDTTADRIIESVFEVAVEAAEHDASKRSARGYLPNAVMVDRNCVLVRRRSGDLSARPYRRLIIDDDNFGLAFLLFVYGLLGTSVATRPDDIDHVAHDGVVEVAWPAHLLGCIPPD